MKLKIFAFFALGLVVSSAYALNRPRQPGQVYHSQCAKQVQAAGIKKVCLSNVQGQRARYITLTDAKGNGSAFAIVGATADPIGRGPERVTFLTLKLSGDIIADTYKWLSTPGIELKVEQRHNVKKGALIQVLKGNFTRVGEVSASNCQNVLYPQ